LKICGIILALILSVCSTATGQVQKPRQVPPSGKTRKQPLLVTIDMANATVKAGSAISVNMLMTNKSRHPIEVGLGSSELSGGLVFRDSQGDESLTDLEQCLRSGGPCNSSSNPWGPCPKADEQCGDIIRLPMRSGNSFALDPGKSTSGTIGFNPHEYDLTRPGKYTVQWQGQCRCSKTILTSNTITVTVIP
jgi:hypothetical protein